MTNYTLNEMNEQGEKREKDALFAAWSEDRQSSAPQPLRVWLNRYPEYAEALISWAADMPVLECALERMEKSVYDTAGEAQTLAIGRQVLAEMRSRYFATAETTPAPQTAPLTDLIQAAKAHGLTAKALAGQVGIGLPLIAKLNQRLVRLATLPETLIERLATALQTNADQVRAYLARPATLSLSAQYKSDGVPQVAAVEDFAEAVRTCSDMNADQKQFWLTQK